MTAAADRSIAGAVRLAWAPSMAFVAVGLFWGCFAAYVPVIKERLGAGDGAFGLLLLGSACGLVSAMWVAPAVDRALGRLAMPVIAVAFALAWVLPGLLVVPTLFFASSSSSGSARGCSTSP